MSVRTDYDVSVVLRRQERPYHSDSTASRLLSEVKHWRARLVLRWGTTLESLVLFFCSFPFCSSCISGRPCLPTYLLMMLSLHCILILPVLLYSSILSFARPHGFCSNRLVAARISSFLGLGLGLILILILISVGTC